jgi:hypothetical protein
MSVRIDTNQIRQAASLSNLGTKIEITRLAWAVAARPSMDGTLMRDG